MFYKVQKSDVIFIFEDDESHQLFNHFNLRKHPGAIKPKGSWYDGITFKSVILNTRNGNLHGNIPITWHMHNGREKPGVVIPAELIKMHNVIKTLEPTEAYVFREFSKLDGSIFIRPKQVLSSRQTGNDGLKASLISEAVRKTTLSMPSSYKPELTAETLFKKPLEHKVETVEVPEKPLIEEFKEALPEVIKQIEKVVHAPPVLVPALEIAKPVIQESKPIPDLDRSDFTDDENVVYAKMLIEEINRYKSLHDDIQAEIQADGKVVVFKRAVMIRRVVE